MNAIKYSIICKLAEDGLSKEEIEEYTPILLAYRRLRIKCDEEEPTDVRFIMSLKEAYQLFDLAEEDHVNEELADMIAIVNIMLAEYGSTMIIDPSR